MKKLQSPTFISVWAVGIPAVASIGTGVAAFFALDDTQYTTAALLSVYTALLPGVAIRNARFLRSSGTTTPRPRASRLRRR